MGYVVVGVTKEGEPRQVFATCEDDDEFAIRQVCDAIGQNSDLLEFGDTWTLGEYSFEPYYVDGVTKVG